MKLKNLAIASGIAEGLEKATTNIINIGQARKDFDAQQKRDDADFKIKKLQLDKLEMELDPDVLKAQHERLKEETKAKKATTSLNNLKLDQAEREAKDELSTWEKRRDMASQFLAGEEDIPEGVSFNFGGVDFSGGKTTKAESFEDDMNSFFSGRMSEQQLRDSHRTKGSQIDKAVVRKDLEAMSPQEIQQKPLERREVGAAMVGRFGGIDDPTQQTYEDLNTYGKLIEFHEQAAVLESKGVDTAAIFETYNTEFAELDAKGLLK